MSEEEVAALGRNRDENAGFGCLRTPQGCVPMSAMDVDARVVGVMAAVELAQTYVNTTATPIEATYIFPMPDRMAVHRFRMEVAGRVIEGVVDERGAAREHYEQAIAAGHRAAITEEERAGVFTLRVGNLMPGEVATIRLSLVGPLPIDDGEVTFRFPLVVAPRYMPGAWLGGEQAGLGVAGDTSLVPDASRISPPVRLPHIPNPVRLGIRVALADGHVRDVASSLHAVTSAMRDAQVIELGPSERLDRDFVLRWRLDGDELRSGLVCADDADGKGGTFMLTFVPPSTLAMSQKPRDVVFVIDRSGSMEGWKMQAARRATARMIDTLTSRDRFFVIAFDNAIEVLPDVQLGYATDRMRFKAVEELAKVNARGGTELEQPLSLAVRTLAGGHDDRERVIVLVTDGQVGNEDHILRQVAPNLRNVRVFTLGIDQAVNGAFLRRLAGAGGGLCELVESEDRLDVVMSKVHRRIGTPVATEMRLDAHGMDIVWNQVAPAKLPDVYAGAPVVVLGRYRGAAALDAAVTVDGTSFGEPMRLRIARESTTGTSALGASWARAYIRDLEDKYATGSRELEGEIVRVSKQWNVLSKFTAFLAVDRSEVVNPGGRLAQAVQPVESPAGWEGAASGAVGGMPSLPGGMPSPMSGGGSLRSRAVMPARAMAAGRPMAAGGKMAPPMDGAFASPPPPPMAPRPTESAPMPAFADLSIDPASPSPAEKSIAAPRPAPRTPGPASNSMSAPPSYRPPMQQAPAKGKREAEPSDALGRSASGDASAYLAKLQSFARELEAEARGAVSVGKLKLLRQRLREWVEDLRSVGGFDSLADVVEQLAHKLGDAIAAADVATQVASLATQLANVAAGGAVPPRSTGRPAFWK
ncbi:MAG TPA: VIT domain-containing protein [Kofleriaceae bacterium]|nr:VIT domain-containing protein [Kofleriaceae bacterium]